MLPEMDTTSDVASNEYESSICYDTPCMYNFVTIQCLRRQLNLLIDRINGYIREIEDLGCFVQEFKRGVINFPTLYVGRKVFLCWRPGDEEVRYWHELDESFTERTPIRDFRDFFFQRTDKDDN